MGGQEDCGGTYAEGHWFCRDRQQRILVANSSLHRENIRNHLSGSWTMKKELCDTWAGSLSLFFCPSRRKHSKCVWTLLFWWHFELLNVAFHGFLLWKFWRGASKGKVNYGDFNYRVRAGTDGGADTWELRVKLLAFEVLSNASSLLGSNCILQLCDLLHLPLYACVRA